jgi:hypothetical protein
MEEQMQEHRIKSVIFKSLMQQLQQELHVLTLTLKNMTLTGQPKDILQHQQLQTNVLMLKHSLRHQQSSLNAKVFHQLDHAQCRSVDGKR